MKRTHSPSPPSSPILSKSVKVQSFIRCSIANNQDEADEDRDIFSDDLHDHEDQLKSFDTGVSETENATDSTSVQIQNTYNNDRHSELTNKNNSLASESMTVSPDIDEMYLLTQTGIESSEVHNETMNNIHDDSSPKFMSLATMLSKKLYPLSLGCPLLNKALVGGLRRGELTEVVGESSAGKTQFCLQCAAMTAMQGDKVVYIVTEGSFPQARLDQMVEALDRKDIRDNILVQQVQTLHHLHLVIGRQLESVVKEVGLVIIDSIAAIIRYDGELSTGLDRGNTVHHLGQALVRVALKHEIGVLAVNQVTDRVEDGKLHCYPWGRRVAASLGLAWTQYPHTRLWLTKTRLVISKKACDLLSGLVAETRLRTMHVDWSCRLKTSTTHFLVDAKGVRGVRIVDD